MIDWLASFGAGLIQAAVYFLILFAGIWVGAKLMGRFAPNASENISCLLVGLIAIAIMTLLSVVFGPAIEALQHASCSAADDYDLCINPQGRDWM